ncbi:MAG TPA: hypothetical protein VJN94_10590 [Candidatus Binataceae bacterium]|nr:hypothetical protein [Candidatus Binataceae bacterium]
MNIDVVRDRLARLSDLGSELIQTRYKSDLSHQEFVDASAFREWRVGCVAFLREALGGDSPYTKEFEFNCDSHYLSSVARGQAVLRAAREYIDFGPVARVEELVAAEIFTDLLGMAERLIRQRHLGSAIAVACAVLEDVMRRSARHRKIAIRENVDELTELNAKMAAAGVYGEALRKRIDEWAEIRTRAESSEPAAEARVEVERLLKGVRDFVNDHLF